MKLGKILGSVGKAFLGSVVGSVGDRAGGAVSDAIFGPNNLPSQGDYDRYQDLLNSSADDEAMRDATRHNSFANNTMRQDMARYGEMQPFLRGVDRDQNTLDSEARAKSDKAYMDEVYAGTSNWERLGSSAAPSLSMAGPSKAPGGQQKESGFLGSVMPLMSIQMQNETQKAIARTQQETQKDVAEIQGQTARDVAGINTAGGQLPRQQTIESASRVLLQSAQQWQAEAQAGKTQVETLAVRQRMAIDAVSTFLAASPKEIIDLGLIRYESRPGYKNILEIMNNVGDPYTIKAALQEALGKMPPSQFEGIKRDAIEIAAYAGKGAQAIKGFLPNLRFGKGRTTHGARRKNQEVKQVWQREDGSIVQ